MNIYYVNSRTTKNSIPISIKINANTIEDLKNKFSELNKTGKINEAINEHQCDMLILADDNIVNKVIPFKEGSGYCIGPTGDELINNVENELKRIQNTNQKIKHNFGDWSIFKTI